MVVELTRFTFLTRVLQETQKRNRICDLCIRRYTLPQTHTTRDMRTGAAPCLTGSAAAQPCMSKFIKPALALATGRRMSGSPAAFSRFVAALPLHRRSWVADAPDGAERRASTCGPWRGRALQPAAAHRLGSAPATPEPGMWRSQPGTWRAPTTTPSSFGCALCDKSNGHTNSRFAPQIRSPDLRLRFAPHVFCLFLLAILSCFSSWHGYAFLVCRCRWGRVRRLQTTAI